MYDLLSYGTLPTGKNPRYSLGIHLKDSQHLVGTLLGTTCIKAAHISGIGQPLGTPFITLSHIGTIVYVGTLSE